MGHQYAGASSFPVDFTIPDDGDDIDAGSVDVAFEALADRTIFLKNHPLLSTASFTASGTWFCPPNVTSVLVYGVGGGGGGGGSSSATIGGGGGGGAHASVVRVTTVPGTTYTVTIGAGGAAGSGGADGGDGGDTTLGTLARFMGARGGGGDSGTPFGGGPIRGMTRAAGYVYPGQGGQGDTASNNGFIHATGPSAGGTGAGVDAGGGGGSSGWPGGIGGAGGSSSTGFAGALGGGGGGGDDAAGGVGGNGAMQIVYSVFT